VEANYKETHLRRIRVGMRVNIAVDAYPDTSFTGRVESVQSGTGAVFSLLPPENATGNYVKVVQRVPVKIVFDPLPDTSDRILVPGMSVVPTVLVNSPRLTAGVTGRPSPPAAVAAP
jgi:membrane fusion protein (multidrug efflux system)